MTNKSLLRVLAIAAAAAGASTANTAFAKPPAAPTLTPASDLKWESLMGEGGPQMAVLWGDPKKGGESGFLLKLPAGMVSPMHSHTSDYWAVTVAGTMSHYAEGQPEADAKPLPPGSLQMMPAKVKHVSKCAPGAECIISVRMKGKFDFVPADKAAAGGAKPAAAATPTAAAPAAKPAAAPAPAAPAAKPAAAPAGKPGGW